MTDIFISYSHTDRPRIEKLAAALEAEGFSVWWDFNLSAGAHFPKETEAKLKEARIVIVAWSAASIESMWVADEATIGRSKGILVPIAIDAVEPPIGFRQIQTMAFDKWHGDPSAPAFQTLATAITARLKGEAPARPAPKQASWKDRLLKPLPLAGALIAALAIIAAIVFIGRPGQGVAPRDKDAATAASIAVLPFTDLSPEGDQAYFSDGVAEEILNVLARIDGLKVASRTSSFQFRDREAGAPAIAAELGVRHILEGSVRKSGATIRITAQLIDASEDRHLWSETYDRPLTTENLFEIQDEIAKSIVGQLADKMGVGPAAPDAVTVQADTQNVEAYELYLKGRELFIARGTENLTEAARALEQATTLDRKFARAWETLALVYAIAESWSLPERNYSQLALDAADAALRLNPELSMPYAARGVVLQDSIDGGRGGDWQAVLANLNEAVARDPKNATAWFWRGQAHLYLGFFDRGIEDIGRCRELDPGYRYCLEWLAIAHRLAGRYDEALRLFEQAPDRVSGSANVEFAAVYAARGDRESARGVLNKIYAENPQLAAPLFRAMADPAFSKSDRTKALSLLDNLPRPFTGEVAAHFILGDYDGMPDSLDSMIWWYRSDDRYLKSPARKALMRRFSFPEYWRAHGFPPQCKPVGADDFECD